MIGSMHDQKRLMYTFAARPLASQPQLSVYLALSRQGRSKNDGNSFDEYLMELLLKNNKGKKEKSLVFRRAHVKINAIAKSVKE